MLTNGHGEFADRYPMGLREAADPASVEQLPDLKNGGNVLKGHVLPSIERRSIVILIQQFPIDPDLSFAACVLAAVWRTRIEPLSVSCVTRNWSDDMRWDR